MPRRRGGLAALKKKREQLDAARRAGQELHAEKIEHVERVVAEFKVRERERERAGSRRAGTAAADAHRRVRSLSSRQKHLETFATKHRRDINGTCPRRRRRRLSLSLSALSLSLSLAHDLSPPPEDPEFRRDFQTLCQNIGVDPLASSKGFWADLLGLNDFYYELGVQVVDVCLSTRASNGGLIAMSTLLRRLRATRVSTARAVSAHDVATAIRKLRRLGGGFELVERETETFVRSVPSELSVEQSRLLDLGKENEGRVTIALATARTGWSRDFAENALDVLMREGTVWIDRGDVDDEGTDAAAPSYWFPSMWKASTTG